MILIQAPSAWNSAHQPIIYEFGFEELEMYAVNDISGYAQFDFDCGGICQTFSPTPVAGDRFYVPSGTYQGFHIITSVDSSLLFTTETPYVSTQSGVDVKHIPTVTFILVKGYASGEGWDAELPLENVVSFTPSVSPDVTLRFDVSGYLKSIFTIAAPTIGIDFSLFNRFRLFFEDAYDVPYQVLNSSIPTDELNSVYFGTGVYLSSSTTQIIFGCGKTILSLLDATGVVINEVAEDGDTGADYFYDDYNEEDYLTQIST